MLDVARIRQDFPILSRRVNGVPLVYLDNAATSQKPRSVIRSLVDFYERYNSNVHRGVHTLSMEATDAMEEARTKVASFINAESPNCIIWTRGATEALNLVARSWAMEHVKPGDEIVTTAMEHHSNLVPWQQVARERGAQLRFLPIAEDGTLDLSAVDSIIGPRTRLVTVVHMSNSLGTINPVKELGAKARAVGAAFLVDGAQSVPHMPVDVQDIDCDFMAFSGHKMLGPTGIGALYARREVLERMEPFLVGGEMVLQVTYEDATWNDLPMRFEAGTPNIAGAIGLGAAIDYLQALGMDQVREHEAQITGYALDAFKELEDVDVFGPPDPAKRGGVIPFHTSEVHAHDFGTVLDRRGIAVRTGHHCTMPLMGTLGVAATVRASFYIYNTEEEVDMLVDAVREAMRYFLDGSG
jgi:cysteine desulfurase/selenocysteine lyase